MANLTFLGTGTSHGVPMIGCTCPTCSSADSRDKRTNASVLLRSGGKNILIDCGRDFRQQALREQLVLIDYVLLTHVHFDHVAGIDDLRVFNHHGKGPIPLMARRDHLDYLRRYIYHYLFDEDIQTGGGITKLQLVAVEGNFSVGGVCFEPLRVYHGEMEIVGYKFLNCAYLSDVSRIPKETLRCLYELDVLILDVLRYRPHSTHLNLSQALEIIEEIKPGQTYLTHLCHEVIHREINQRLKDPEDEYFTELNVEAAYDGLVIELD